MKVTDLDVDLRPDGSVVVAPRFGLKQQCEELRARCEKAETELAELRALLDTPEAADFDKGAPLEAAHQVRRWGSDHDAGKQPEDWFWLVGYLAGKALAAHKMSQGCSEATDDRDEVRRKALHHCVSTAAVLRNWHSFISTGGGAMRPGLPEEKVVGL